MKPVAETDAGEVLVGEHDRDHPARAASGDDHFGVGDMAGVVSRLPWWQRVPGLSAVPDRLESGGIERRPPAPLDDLARFGPGRHRQHAWLVGVGWRPWLAESGLDPGALPLKLWIAVRA